ESSAISRATSCRGSLLLQSSRSRPSSQGRPGIGASLQSFVYGADDEPPGRRRFLQAFGSLRGDAVDDAVPAGDRFPAAGEQTIVFQAVQNWIDAPFSEFQHSARCHPNGLHELIPIHGPRREQMQNEQLGNAVQKVRVGAFARHGGAYTSMFEAWQGELPRLS